MIAAASGDNPAMLGETVPQRGSRTCLQGVGTYPDHSLPDPVSDRGSPGANRK